MDDKLTPKLRFAGFTDAWEQCELGDCFQERTEKMPEGELLSVTINDGIKRFIELERHDNSNDDKSKYKKVCIGDIAYNSMRMWQGASGYSPYEGIVSPAYTVLSPKEGIDSSFFAFLFKRAETIHSFKINSQGITSDTWNLKYPAFSKIKISKPKTTAEQEVISSIFRKIDTLLPLHQRKCDQLKSIKTALLQKMFPKNGENVPEIRFAGFTDAWEQRKLGELIEERNNRTSDFGNFPLYSLTIENGITEKTDRYERSALVTKKEDMFKIVALNEFVTNPMNLRFGALGYNKNCFNVSVSGYYDVFSIDDNKCSSFWNSYFKTPIALKIFDNAATGSLIEKRRVKLSTLKNLDFLMPSKIDERILIGEFFSSLDTLLTLHQHKCEELKNIKKALLQNMFV